jgi:galactonate dehydratase
MKITEVEIYEVEYKDTPNWHPILIRIRTDEGISGVGEVGLAYGAGGSAGAGMVKNLAKEFLIGADPMRIEYLWDLMYRKSFWGQGGGPVVFGGMSAIDHALWDIKGKALGVPVYELLGGHCHDKLLVYANGWYHDYNRAAEWAEPIQKIMADGYKAVKFDPFRKRPDGVNEYSVRALDKDREDLAVERVAAVREVGGPDFIICVEVHGNLGPTSAIRAGQRLEELNPFFYEEPVDALNVDVMAKVAESVNIPLAAGERLYTRYGFRQYIERQALAIIQPDLGLAGGIMEVKKIAAHAETYNIHVQPHNCASPVMTAASVQVDACIPNFIIQETFPYRPAEHYEVVLNPLEKQIVDGYLPIPTEPGLGVELNDDFLKNQPCVRVV